MPHATTSDGVRLHYRVHDCTDPWRRPEVLILQHGFGRSSRFWYNLAPYLCRFYRVVCPDLRGLGESGRNFDLATGLSADRYLADLATIADAVGAPTFHYAGESLGGMLGMALAAQVPERVRTLTLMSASLTIRPDAQKAFAFEFPSWEVALRTLGAKGWAERANQVTRFPPGTDQGLMDWYAAEFGKSDVEVLLAMQGVARSLDLEPLLSRIKAPALGLYPSQGAFAKSGQEAVLKAKLPQLRVVHFPTTFHMVWVLEPVACAHHMLHFMAAHDGIPCHE